MNTDLSSYRQRIHSWTLRPWNPHLKLDLGRHRASLTDLAVVRDSWTLCAGNKKNFRRIKKSRDKHSTPPSVRTCTRLTKGTGGRALFLPVCRTPETSGTFETFGQAF